MGTRMKDMAAGPIRMVGAAAERLPGLAKKKKKPSKLVFVKRVVEGAGAALSVAVTGWEVYELLRSAGVGGSKAKQRSSKSTNSKSGTSKPRGSKSKGSASTTKRSRGGSKTAKTAKASSASASSGTGSKKRSDSTKSSGTKAA